MPPVEPKNKRFESIEHDGPLSPAESYLLDVCRYLARRIDSLERKLKQIEKESHAQPKG